MSMYIKHFLYNHVSFLIMHDGYPVKTMKKQRKCSIVFSGNTGFPKNNREKRKGNKNFKVLFSLFLFLPICKKSVNTVEKRNSLVPSFLSGGQNRNDDRRKEYNMTLSEESDIG